MAQLQQAAQISDAPSKQKAAATVQQRLQNERKLLRDQAYTHVKKIVDTIRQYGPLEFWRSPDPLKSEPPKTDPPATTLKMALYGATPPAMIRLSMWKSRWFLSIQGRVHPSSNDFVGGSKV
ncbi:MAG: hypothetical protein JXX14_15580 [Deltaproteobacteria bacterium]|nr:hypothetical protein [Deltaproteobacteria bacterium]